MHFNTVDITGAQGASVRTLVELIAILMRLTPALNAVELQYWKPDYDGGNDERRRKLAGKWVIDIRGDYGTRPAYGLGDTPEAAVQSAIDNRIATLRARTDESLKQAGENSVALREALAIASGEAAPKASG
jgi:hypothetical protein